ncbi:acyl-CoA oxidase [Testicularia cyperi]|uniref:Acyl-coenzyme A oxidase n=1 Tax=Testicularia cyperi TaxID=1882483 RepID=A0A317XJT6_9BASI|nr:acyl-CoA oxidase [Testicularia cyperi]
MDAGKENKSKAEGIEEAAVFGPEFPPHTTLPVTCHTFFTITMAPPRFVEISEDLKPAGVSGTELLTHERSKASFDSKAMAEYIHGKEYLDAQERMVDLLTSDPVFDKSSDYYYGRADKFRRAMLKDKRLAQLAEEHGWGQFEIQLAEKLADMPGPMGLHKSMFLTTLFNQGTEEQRKAFYEPASRYEIIGCYAQTELGHGSNVQGIETTATWIQDTQEWEINSPTLTASKWWIGGLGRTADHAVVMAQLIINNKSYGPHPLVVPIRDIKTREVLPGRTIGDIGPKAGYNTTDNGFMLFDHVRVPHFNLLARFSKVLPESGKYMPPLHAKLAYGTLMTIFTDLYHSSILHLSRATWPILQVFIRASIVREAASVLMRAVTVAVRYCAVRRQFADRDAPKFGADNKPLETQVLDYTMVQIRLFPILAQAFAFHYTSKFMFELYQTNQANIEAGDTSLLADTHASSSGLKSLTTLYASDAIEVCRKACGGHGYSMASGLPDFYANYLPQATWEGDSYMLSQQCTRYLFKMMRGIKQNRDKVDNNVTKDYMCRYLDHKTETANVEYSGDLYDPLFFMRAFGHRAAYLTEQTLALRDDAKRSWNSLLVELFRCSKAHSQYLLVRNFGMAILKDDKLNSQPALRQIVQKIFLLFACFTMEQESADFLASGYINGKQFHLLGSKVQEIMAELRPNAVALVDSFAIPDYLLNSALGRSDGKVYESLFDFALREPLNSAKWNVDIRDLNTTDFESDLPKSKL